MSKLRNNQHLFWIVIVAFVARAAVRWHSGEADFWINCYCFFFDMAQNIATGKGMAEIVPLPVEIVEAGAEG